MSSTTITIRISVDLKDRLLRALERDQRTMTNFVCVAVEERILRVNATRAVLELPAAPAPAPAPPAALSLASARPTKRR